MDLIALSVWLPKWLDPQRSSAPAKLAYTALILLVVVVVYLDRRIVKTLQHRRSRHAGRASGPSKA